MIKYITHRKGFGGILVKRQWAVKLDVLLCKINKTCWMCGDKVLYNSPRQMCLCCEREEFGH
jgi:hypothetical protein